jgi:hypothetical protein
LVGRFGGLLAGAQCAPLRQNPHRGTQISDLGGQATHPQLVLILDRAGDRTGPPRRGHRGDRLFALGAPRRYTEPKNSPIAVSAAASASVT